MTVAKIILIACGSFNPPTYMHLRMFEVARDHLNRTDNYEVIGGLISPVHDAYGKKDLLSSTHRIAMVKLALQSSDWIKLSDWECQQESHSRTLISLRHHQNQINAILNNRIDNINEQDVPWCPTELKSTLGNVQVKLLCGADLLESFAVPGLWSDDDIEAIVGQHGLVVISRENSNPQKFIYCSDVLTKYMNNIILVTEWITNDVSSTKIRRSLRRNESVRYLIPDKVIDYIYKNSLYGTQKPKYLFPPVLVYNSTTPSPVDASMDSPSPTNIHCINICNNNLFSNRSDENRMTVDTVENLNKTNIINSFKHPGQAVKVITNASGDHTVLKKEENHTDSEVCESVMRRNSSKALKTSKSCTSFKKLESTVSLQGSKSNENLKDYKTCDENLIKFIFTKHGIQVISDIETIV